MPDSIPNLLRKLPGASLISSLGEVVDAVRTASDAEILGLVSVGAARELLGRLVARDLHPAVVWSFHAANRPDDLALVQGERRLTWREANTRINQLANGLLDRGIKPGDRVAVMLENSIQWFELVVACQKIGASTVFVSYRSAAPEIGYLLSNSQASLLFFGAEHADVVREARSQSTLPNGCWIRVGEGLGDEFVDYEAIVERGADSEPPADLRRGGSRTILYTSGTTGRPKGAVRDLSKASLGTLLGLLRRIPFRRSDRHLVAAPLYHATGSGFATLSTTLGSTVSVMENFDAEEFLRIVDREKITTTALVPTMIRAIVDLSEETRKRYDLSSLRIVISTGSVLSDEIERAATAVLGEEVLYDLYGSTEMAYVTVATPADKRACPGTIGLPVPGVEVLLLDEQRRPVPDGEIGELFARSELTVEGYHGNESATRESRFGDAFSVGDLAVRDPRGYLKLVGRKTDMVISGGMNVYPAEIEGVLSSHPAIREAAVVGVPSSRWGESLVAFVAGREGENVPDDEALVGFLKKSLAGYKVPRHFERLESLPRNPTGKILKNELRSRITRRG